MTDTERIARIWHESWDRRDPDRGAAVVADDCCFDSLVCGEPRRAPDGYRKEYERWRTAFPDGACKIVKVIARRDLAIVQLVNRGTHTGVLYTGAAAHPPSGRRIELRYCNVMRVRDGMVLSGRDYHDTASLARQLGLMPLSEGKVDRATSRSGLRYHRSGGRACGLRLAQA